MTEEDTIKIVWNETGIRKLGKADGLSRAYVWHNTDGTQEVVEVAREDALNVMTAGNFRLVDRADHAKLRADADAPSQAPTPKPAPAEPETKAEAAASESKPKRRSTRTKPTSKASAKDDKK